MASSNSSWVIDEIALTDDAKKGTSKEIPALINEIMLRLVNSNIRTESEENRYEKLLSTILEHMQRTDESSLPNQLESAKALVNLSSGKVEYTKKIVDCGALPILVRSLRSPYLQLGEYVASALANIVFDSPVFCSECIDLGCVPVLVSLIQPYSSTQLLREVSRALKNLSVHETRPVPIENFQKMISGLTVLLNYEDSCIFQNTMWTIIHNIRIGPQQRQMVLDSPIITRKLKKMLNRRIPVLYQALAATAVGTLASGYDGQIQSLINKGVLGRLKSLLSTKTDKRVLKRVFWALSNIAAGTVEQIQALINSEIIVPVVKNTKYQTADIREEAVSIVKNVASRGSLDQLEKLFGKRKIHTLLTTLLFSNEWLPIENIIRERFSKRS